MGRRKKGRQLSGWLIVDKPAGVTSTTLVNRARGALGAQKAGHGGTLDPAATGLLVIALGEATKVLPAIEDALKAYEFTVTWGAETTTDDAEGSVTQTSEHRPTAEEITAALPAFTGDIRQVPPAFSAVHVDGQRAYALARAGAELDLAARDLHVADLSLIDMPDADTARLRMVCGKGGYVRAIARDLGRTLGCLGHVRTLRRIWAGPFTLEDHAIAWPEESVEALPAATGADDSAIPPRNRVTREDLEPALLPVEAGLVAVPECRCAPDAAPRLANGNPVEVTYTNAQNGETAWASVSGQAVALGVYKFGHFHPSRVFNRSADDLRPAP